MGPPNHTFAKLGNRRRESDHLQRRTNGGGLFGWGRGFSEQQARFDQGFRRDEKGRYKFGSCSSSVPNRTKTKWNQATGRGPKTKWTKPARYRKNSSKSRHCIAERQREKKLENFIRDPIRRHQPNKERRFPKIASTKGQKPVNTKTSRSSAASVAQ